MAVELYQEFYCCEVEAVSRKAIGPIWLKGFPFQRSDFFSFILFAMISCYIYQLRESFQCYLFHDSLCSVEKQL